MAEHIVEGCLSTRGACSKCRLLTDNRRGQAPPKGFAVALTKRELSMERLLKNKEYE